MDDIERMPTLRQRGVKYSSQRFFIVHAETDDPSGFILTNLAGAVHAKEAADKFAVDAVCRFFKV